MFDEYEHEFVNTDIFWARIQKVEQAALTAPFPGKKQYARYTLRAVPLNGTQLKQRGRRWKEIGTGTGRLCRAAGLTGVCFALLSFALPCASPSLNWTHSENPAVSPVAPVWGLKRGTPHAARVQNPTPLLCSNLSFPNEGAAPSSWWRWQPGELSRTKTQRGIFFSSGRSCGSRGADPHSLLSLSLSSTHSPHPPHGRSTARGLKSGADWKQEVLGVVDRASENRKQFMDPAPTSSPWLRVALTPISTPTPGRPGLPHDIRCWKCRVNIFGVTGQAVSKLLNFAIVARKHQQIIKWMCMASPVKFYLPKQIRGRIHASSHKSAGLHDDVYPSTWANNTVSAERRKNSFLCSLHYQLLL